MLTRELDAWHAAGRHATLWWRDDDAAHDSAALGRLLKLASANDVPATVAVVPATFDVTLVEALAGRHHVTVVQHGYAHANHAPADERGAELGAHRTLARRLDELARGRRRLDEAFGPRFLEALVPPWNRIADDLPPSLPGVGLHGLSCFGARVSARPQPGLVQANTHVDPIAWRRDRAFIGTDKSVERIVGHLYDRRAAKVDPTEPTGLLTHHLVFDDDAWDFVAALLGRTRRHPAVTWLAAEAVFATPDG